MLGKSLLNQLPPGFYQNPRGELWTISLATDLAAQVAIRLIYVDGILNWCGLALAHGRGVGRLFDLGSSFFVQMVRAVDGAVVKH